MRTNHKTKLFSSIVLSVRHVYKNFGPIKAVSDISFSVEKSKTIGLLGSNGAGKTTTIMMLMGILKVTSGEIKILEQDVYKHRNKIAKEINFASPFVELPHRLTVLQNLNVFGHLYGVKSLADKIYKVSSDLDILDLLKRRVGKLSAGQKTRVSLAKSLINDPKILFLDEPTASLDPDNADWVRTYLEKYQKRTGATFILASHNMPEVERLCHNVVMMGKGKLIDSGTPKDLITRYKCKDLEEVFLQLARNDKV
ncbi:MAG: ABC transporter ATP-binding protein [Alphaproteobacteria bacterium]|nr:ABC transporter ATP-binding protein [Alphaproteobacteria bacterium]